MFIYNNLQQICREWYPVILSSHSYHRTDNCSATLDDFKVLTQCVRECGCLWVPCILSFHRCSMKSASGIKKLYIKLWAFAYVHTQTMIFIYQIVTNLFLQKDLLFCFTCQPQEKIHDTLFPYLSSNLCAFWFSLVVCSLCHYRGFAENRGTEKGT